MEPMIPDSISVLNTSTKYVGIQVNKPYLAILEQDIMTIHKSNFHCFNKYMYGYNFPFSAIIFPLRRFFRLTSEHQTTAVQAQL